jgi:hypothetical protein
MSPRRPGGQGTRRPAPDPRPNTAATDPASDTNTVTPDAAPDAGWLPGQPRHLTDPAIAEHITAFVATAPAMTEDQCRKLARLLRTNRCPIDRPEPSSHSKPVPNKSIPPQRRPEGDRRREQAA